MSLDVYLTEPTLCPHCAKDTGRGDEVFWRNITHNLNTMADAAGVYAACWRPDGRASLTRRAGAAPSATPAPR